MPRSSLLGDSVVKKPGPLVQISAEKSTSSPGVDEKPKYCGDNCPLAYKSSGFVADWVPEDPIMAIVDPTPGKGDLIERVPFSGPVGQYFKSRVLVPAGVAPDRVIYSYVLRCRPRGDYPIGREKKLSETSCRHWDTVRGFENEVLENSGRSLQDWAPDLFTLTFSPMKIVEVAAYEALAIEDIKKALRFAQAGYRPVVFLGAEGLEFAAPWLVGTGGIKNWRGHWWEGNWRWQGNCGSEESTPGFITAKKPVWRRMPKGFGGKKKSAVPKQTTLF